MVGGIFSALEPLAFLGMAVCALSLARNDAERPYYREVGSETSLFRHAHAEHMPLLLKGPTGCG